MSEKKRCKINFIPQHILSINVNWQIYSFSILSSIELSGNTEILVVWCKRWGDEFGYPTLGLQNLNCVQNHNSVNLENIHISA